MRSGYGMPHGSGPQPTQGVPATTAPAEAAESASVTISQMRFNAPSITVKAGGTVTWTNSESTPHTVTADDGSFGSSQLTTGDTFSIQFDEPGTYTYYCQYHPSMRATVVVVA
jgi:amicyanin